MQLCQILDPFGSVMSSSIVGLECYNISDVQPNLHLPCLRVHSAGHHPIYLIPRYYGLSLSSHSIMSSFSCRSICFHSAACVKRNSSVSLLWIPLPPSVCPSLLQWSGSREGMSAYCVATLDCNMLTHKYNI